MHDQDSMAKYPKFRLSLLSFQLCSSKTPSSLPITPLPKTLSPINSKAFDIAYPIIIPNPPPSTPNHDHRNIVGSKIMPLDCGYQSRSSHHYNKDGCHPLEIYRSRISDDSIAPPPPRNKKKNRSKKSKPSFSEGGDIITFKNY
ncbi:transcription repressor OFP7-like [Forsythia ovata]|uniref:Transcription repressor OFP7-like n=1 Tax=Forsythia ovata TaxID=205694 RepID=A0ABD1U8Z1_9LAMI